MTHIKKSHLGIIGLLVLALLGGAVGYYFMHKSPANQKAMHMPAPVVDVVNVDKMPVFAKESFVAKVESKDVVGLRARVQGFLQERLFEEGDIVSQGTPLFVIEQVNFEATVRQAMADVAKGEADVVNTKAQYNRNQTLYKTKDVSKARLDETKAAYLSAEANLAQAKATLDLAQKDLEYTTILSPMDGKIGESRYSVGELIGPTSDILAEIVRVNPVQAVFSISENQLSKLQKNFAVNNDVLVDFITNTGQKYPIAGHISFVDVKLDNQMNTLKIKADFDNPDNALIAGQFGRVQLTATMPQNEIVIPQKAVQQDMIGAYVYVIDSNDKVVRRDITRGQELDNFMIVVDLGLKENEKIVVSGFQRIMPDMTVSVNEIAIDDKKDNQ